MRRPLPVSFGGLLLAACDGPPTTCIGCGRTTDIFCRACAYASGIGTHAASLQPLRPPSPALAASYRWGTYVSPLPGRFAALPSPAARCLQAFKYRGDRRVGRLLARRFGAAVGVLAGRYDLIVPVPLDDSRLRGRGFNQSAWFAHSAAKALAEPLASRALSRRLCPTPQRQNSGDRRRHSQIGAFGAGTQARRVRGCRVLLVDDVITTGATLSDAARAVLTLGAREVASVAVLVAERRRC